MAMEMLTNGASMLAEAAAGDDDEDDCDWVPTVAETGCG